VRHLSLPLSSSLLRALASYVSVSSRLASQAAINFVGGDEIAVIDAEPAAGIHHLIGGGRERHRAAQLAAELERQQHVLLLQRDVGERHGGHLSLQDERSAIAQDRRGGNALENGVDGDLARNAAFLRERHRLA